MIIPVDDEIAQVMARSHGNWSHTTAIRNSTNRLLALASEQQHKQTSDHSTTFEGEIKMFFNDLSRQKVCYTCIQNYLSVFT